MQGAGAVALCAAVLLLSLQLVLVLLCVRCCTVAPAAACCCCSSSCTYLATCYPRCSTCKQQHSSTYCHLFVITKKNTLVHPLAAQQLLCGLGFNLHYSTSPAITGMRAAAGRRQPAAAKPPCIPYNTQETHHTKPHHTLWSELPSFCLLYTSPSPRD